MSTYALRGAIAETLTTSHHHDRRLQDRLTSSWRQASTIYEALDATTPAVLPRKIKKVWRLDSDKLPCIPLNELRVKGVDPDYKDFEDRRRDRRRVEGLAAIKYLDLAMIQTCQI